MRNFIELFEELKKYDLSLKTYLSEKWEGKDKQESVFRLFAYMGLIPEFTNITSSYSICDGNFNKGSIRPNTNKKILFQSSLKDKGDISDLSLMKKNSVIMERNELIITTSKNLVNYGVGDLDILKIQAIFNKYYKEKFTMRLCIVVRDKNELLRKCETAETSSELIVNDILNPNTIIIDWSDLEKYYYYFREQVCKNSMSLDHLMNVNKKSFINEFHQIISRDKITELFKLHLKVLLGCIPRSGKSYIMGGLCIPDGNYLIITTAPNETIEQYKSMFSEYIEFNNKEVIHLTGDNYENEQTTKTLDGFQNTIIICSKQFLQNKVKPKETIKWLQNIVFSIRFIDEAHLGGSSDLAKEVLDTYGKTCKTLFMTATYNKPVNSYGIIEKAQVLWDMEDINLCKKLNFPRLIEKHNFNIELLKVFDNEYFQKTYSKYPDEKDMEKELLEIDGELLLIQETLLH